MYTLRHSSSRQDACISAVPAEKPVEIAVAFSLEHHEGFRVLRRRPAFLSVPGLQCSPLLSEQSCAEVSPTDRPVPSSFVLVCVV